MVWTLCATDLSTGWTGRVPVTGKGQTRIVAALKRIQLHLPFSPLGLHPDNGSGFLNWHLLRWCRQTGILLSCYRPKHKNDHRHFEQKNWTLVHRLVVGSPRMDVGGQVIDPVGAT